MGNKSRSQISRELYELRHDEDAFVDYLSRNSRRVGECWALGTVSDGRVRFTQNGTTVSAYITRMIAEMRGDLRGRRCSTTCGHVWCVNPTHVISGRSYGALVDSPEAFLERLREDSEPTPEGCWQWTGTIDTNGYIQAYYPRQNGSRTIRLHRLIARVFLDGKDADVVHHKCANRSCVNPDHLQVTTQNDNLAEMLARNSYLKQIDDLRAALREYEPDHPLLTDVA